MEIIGILIYYCMFLEYKMQLSFGNIEKFLMRFLYHPASEANVYHNLGLNVCGNFTFF